MLLFLTFNDASKSCNFRSGPQISVRSSSIVDLDGDSWEGCAMNVEISNAVGAKLCRLYDKTAATSSAYNIE